MTFSHPFTYPIPPALVDRPLSEVRAWAGARMRADCLARGYTIDQLPRWQVIEDRQGQLAMQGTARLHRATTVAELHGARVVPVDFVEADRHGLCSKGRHPMTEENTAPKKSRGDNCRACRREYDAARKRDRSTSA